MIKYLEDDNFDELIKQEFVLVDFYADWCGPCKRMGEILENINNCNILKVNVDLYSDLAREYKVMSIPTMIIFKNGVLVSQQIGMMEEKQLKEWIDQNK